MKNLKSAHYLIKHYKIKPNFVDGVWDETGYDGSRDDENSVVYFHRGTFMYKAMAELIKKGVFKPPSD